MSRHNLIVGLFLSLLLFGVVSNSFLSPVSAHQDDNAIDVYLQINYKIGKLFYSCSNEDEYVIVDIVVDEHASQISDTKSEVSANFDINIKSKIEDSCILLMGVELFVDTHSSLKMIRTYDGKLDSESVITYWLVEDSNFTVIFSVGQCVSSKGSNLSFSVVFDVDMILPESGFFYINDYYSQDYLFGIIFISILIFVYVYAKLKVK